jgi:hypothetical protein
MQRPYRPSTWWLSAATDLSVVMDVAGGGAPVSLGEESR